MKCLCLLPLVFSLYHIQSSPHCMCLATWFVFSVSPCVSYTGFGRSTSAMESVCVFSVRMCQLHWLRPVDFGNGVYLCVFCVPMCQLYWFRPVDFGVFSVSPYVSYTGFGQSTSAMGSVCVFVINTNI